MQRCALLLALSMAATLSACKEDRLSSRGCREDVDCGNPNTAFRCEPQTGACFCRTDEACHPTQFCNLSGFCQDRSGCVSNVDCPDSATACDVTTGQCLPLGRCASDVQCTLGQVCNLSRGLCVAGCRSDGDCPGTSCRCGGVPCTCDGINPAERNACAVGVCDSSFCSNDSFCRFGERCGIPADAGAERNQCFSDFDVSLRPYCARCTSGGGGVETCGRGANFCITDTRTKSTYCGADCSENQPCPRGYGCRDIRVVLTRWQCSESQPCPGVPSLPCTENSQCPRGGSCLKEPGQPSGLCAGQCRLREGSSFGFCSCQLDEDCVAESCSKGECTVTRKKCVDDSQCKTIRCVDFEGAGACLIGQNCTPNNGLTCVEVQ